MPSIRSLSNFIFSSLGLVQATLGGSLESHRKTRLPLSSLAASEVCHNPQLSCHNTSAVTNTCCFNSPGGVLLQTQFWDTSPVAGPKDSWTIHGLWPDNCDGTYGQFCAPKRKHSNISDILTAAGDKTLLNYMNKYWVSNEGSAQSFWAHEWNKHGTCISTLRPSCFTDYQPTEEVPIFFKTVVDLFKTLPTYEWLNDAGITPSSSTTYTKQAIEVALSKNHGGKKVYIGCSDNELSEVWYYFNVRGSVQSGTFVPTAPDGGTGSCPDTGIKYLPKGSSGGGSSPTGSGTSSAPSPTSTSSPGKAFQGEGYLNVITSGSKKGCIISKGTWYNSKGGTCATFHARESATTDGAFTLHSSRGKCALNDGHLSCGSHISDATAFSAKSTNLMYDEKTTFYADAVPRGTQQGHVFVQNTDSDGNKLDVELSIQWQSL